MRARLQDLIDGSAQVSRQGVADDATTRSVYRLSRMRPRDGANRVVDQYLSHRGLLSPRAQGLLDGAVMDSEVASFSSAKYVSHKRMCSKTIPIDMVNSKSSREEDSCVYMPDRKCGLGRRCRCQGDVVVGTLKKRAYYY